MKNLIIIAIVFSSLSISAQIEKMDLIGEKKHGFGLSLSSTASSGISYTYFKDKIGFTTTSFFYIDKYDGLFDLGGMFKYQLVKEQNFRVFSYFSSEYKYRKESNFLFNETKVNRYSRINSGVGIGLDLYTDYFIFHLHYGFGAYNNFEVISMLAGGLGVYYRF